MRRGDGDELTSRYLHKTRGRRESESAQLAEHPAISECLQPRDLRLFQVSESSQEYHSRSVDLFIVAKSVGKVSESFDELARRTRHKISLPFAPTPLSAASTSLVKG